MEIKFTVGEVAKFHNLSKQTLIFYDKIGLFKPKIIDKSNGYRYYTAEQLEVLDSILILKEIGVPLKKIKSFLENRSMNSTLNLMLEQKKELEKQKEHLNLIIKRIEKKIETIEHINEFEEKIYFKNIEEEFLAVQEVDAPYDLVKTNIAIKKLLKKATLNSYIYNYQIGVMISAENLKRGNYTTADYAFFKLNNKCSYENVILKPKGLYAIIYHEGKYEEIGTSYRKLLDEIKKKGYKIKSHSYEYCVLDSLTSKSPKDYITKISIMVQKE
ncbi:MerR family transcriptional regulator [Clostridium sp. Ade.TY]|uniref:MerR family transcriptional regulator n=1 Tax=Clostridium sp. Ade.TY TaxID=1391647 RepID=UPI00040BBD42|nr:MerR family transcriptional regulator [Clostridium sp. Ade.TY]